MQKIGESEGQQAKVRAFSDRYFSSHKAPRAKRRPRELCPICGVLAVLDRDHCHATGLPRDRICHRCNVLLGFLEVSDAKREVLHAYIVRWRAAHELAEG